MRNRIVDTQIDPYNASLSSTDSASGIHRIQATIEHQVCLFGPERYEPKYEYPLVIWLHSCSSSEAELENVMPALSMQNYVGCAPRAPIPSPNCFGRFWWGMSSTATAVAEEIVFSAIESAGEQFSINRQRIFLSGFGSGATMALRLALRYPEQFGGVVAICGQFPSEDRAFSQLHLARKLPMLWMYGEKSETCNITSICDSLPLLHAAGLSMEIRQYPCGDELLQNMLSDANSWIMEHVTNQRTRCDQGRQEQFSRN